MATTQSRGTQIDAGDSRGTELRITHIVTSTGGEGVDFLGGQKKRGRLTPPPKIIQIANSRSRTFPSNPIHFHPMFPTGNLPSWRSPCNLTLPPRASARAFCPRHANLRVVLSRLGLQGRCSGPSAFWRVVFQIAWHFGKKTPPELRLSQRRGRFAVGKVTPGGAHCQEAAGVLLAGW